MSEHGSQENPNLKNDKVFSSKKQKAGLPHQMYILLVFINVSALVITIKFFSIFALLGFFCFLAITVLPIYIIHEKDSDAHIVWRKAIFSSSSMNNSKTAHKKVKFINFKG